MLNCRLKECAASLVFSLVFFLCSNRVQFNSHDLQKYYTTLQCFVNSYPFSRLFLLFDSSKFPLFDPMNGFSPHFQMKIHQENIYFDQLSEYKFEVILLKN